MKNKFCENCSFFRHEKNILGGISSCDLDVKALNTFWRNDACEKYKEKENKEVDECLFVNRIEEMLPFFKHPTSQQKE